MLFDRYQIIDDTWNVRHPVDDLLTAFDKRRGDAVTVFRYAGDVTIGAIAIEGIDGTLLVEVFVETWNHPSVIRRTQRAAAGSVGWQLTERGGDLTVVYRRANVIYVVVARDPAVLRAILADMPPGAR